MARGAFFLVLCNNISIRFSAATAGGELDDVPTAAATDEAEENMMTSAEDEEQRKKYEDELKEEEKRKKCERGKCKVERERGWREK